MRDSKRIRLYGRPRRGESRATEPCPGPCCDHWRETGRNYHVATFSGGPLDGNERAFRGIPSIRYEVLVMPSTPTPAHYLREKCNHLRGYCPLDVERTEAVFAISYHGYRRLSANRVGRWAYIYEGIFPKPKTSLTGEVVETHTDAAYGRSEATIKLTNVQGTPPRIGQKVTLT